MTCCAAAICAVVRHSVSPPLPVPGCLPALALSACLGAQSCDRARVASACAGTYPQGCSLLRPLCSGVTNQVSAETRLPDYPIPMPSLCSRPRCSGLSCASRLRSRRSRAVAPLDKARAIARARTSWAKENLIFLFPDGGPSAPKVRTLPQTYPAPPLPPSAALRRRVRRRRRGLMPQLDEPARRRLEQEWRAVEVGAGLTLTPTLTLTLTPTPTPTQTPTQTQTQPQPRPQPKYPTGGTGRPAVADGATRRRRVPSCRGGVQACSELKARAARCRASSGRPEYISTTLGLARP